MSCIPLEGTTPQAMQVVVVDNKENSEAWGYGKSLAEVEFDSKEFSRLNSTDKEAISNAGIYQTPPPAGYDSIRNSSNLIQNVTTANAMDKWIAQPTETAKPYVKITSQTFKGATVKALSYMGSTAPASTNASIYSDWVKVDTSKAYEFSVWMNTPDVSGMGGQDSIRVLTSDSATKPALDDFQNSTMQSIQVSSARVDIVPAVDLVVENAVAHSDWKQYRAIVMPTAFNNLDMKNRGYNVTNNGRFRTSNKWLRVVFLSNGQSGTKRDTHWVQPILNEIKGSNSYYTEAGFESSLAQVTQMFDVVGAMETAEPNIFKDCYTFSDKIAKATQRLTELKFMTTGMSTVLSTVINKDRMLSQSGYGDIYLTSDFEGFIQDNGYINFSSVSALPARGGSATVTAKATMSFKFNYDPYEDKTVRTFRYNGIKQPEWVRVQDVIYDMTAPIDNNTFSLNQGKRFFDMGQSYGVREITLQLAVIADSPQTLRDKFFHLSDWFDTQEETELKFSDNPELSWQVKLNGSNTISQSERVGKINVSFICLQKDAKGKEVEVEKDITVDQPLLELQNEGTAETFPRMKFTLNKDTDYFDIVGAGESQNVSLGSRRNTTPTDEKFDPMPLLNRWDFLSSEKWVRMTQKDVPSAPENIKQYVTDGQMETMDGMGLISKWHYGNKPNENEDGWRGAGLYQTLARSLTDFRVELSPAVLGVIPDGSSNFGDIMLYDQNGKGFARVQWGGRMETRQMDVYLTALGSNNADLDSHSVSLNAGANWNNFQGKIIVERKQNKWRVTVGQYINRAYSPAPESIFEAGESMLKDVRTTDWYDLPRETWNAKLTRVGINLRNFQARNRIPHFTVRRLKVWEYRNPTANDKNKRIVSMKKGDEVVVDFDKAQVWLNGNLEPSLVHPSTDWFSLVKGKNVVGFNNLDAKVHVSWHERFR